MSKDVPSTVRHNHGVSLLYSIVLSVMVLPWFTHVTFVLQIFKHYDSVPLFNIYRPT